MALSKGPQTKWQHLQTCQHKRVDNVVLPSIPDHKIHKDEAVFLLAPHQPVRAEGRKPDGHKHETRILCHIILVLQFISNGSFCAFSSPESQRPAAVVGSLQSDSTSGRAGERGHAGGSGSVPSNVEFDRSGAPDEAPLQPHGAAGVHAGTLQPIRQRPQRPAGGQHCAKFQK